MPIGNGQDAKGRLTPGHKLAKGRPRGSRNKLHLEEAVVLNPQTVGTSRFRALLAGIIADLGGLDMMSTGQMQLARRCAWLSLQCEVMERKAAPVEPFDVSAYVAMTGRLSQALKVLGLKRQPRDVTPTLRDYLEASREPNSEPVD
jgi:hypothetical protein